MTDLPSAPLSRRDLLLAQYDTSYAYLIDRLGGLSDAEYRWEPAPGCWGVRRRADAITLHPVGAGEWVLDYTRAEIEPAPLTTLAWRLCHIVIGQRMRHDYTFGSRSLGRDALTLPGSADEAVAWLGESHVAWRAGLAGLSEADLDVVGLSAYPWGLDPNLPFGAIWWWTNRELIHHGAEIGLLRDLWAARSAPGEARP